MNQLQSTVKLVFSSPIKRSLRGLHRNFVFHRALKQFIRNPGACANPTEPILNDLIYGWGNESWSALNEYLACCIQHSLVMNGPILECGSGLSTILGGIIAKKRGQIYWALEHKSDWAAKVQRYLNKYKIDSVVLCEKLLKDYGTFCWYNPPLKSMPGNFALVICDGPPASTKGGRYGLGRNAFLS